MQLEMGDGTTSGLVLGSHIIFEGQNSKYEETQARTSLSIISIY